MGISHWRHNLVSSLDSFKMELILKVFLALISISYANSTLVINQTSEIELPVNIKIPKEELSFCVSLRFGETIVDVTPLGQIGVDLWLVLNFEGEYGWVGVNSVLYIFLLPENPRVQPLTWFQVCFSSNKTNYIVASQGNLWYQAIRSDAQKLQKTELNKIRFAELDRQSSQTTNLELSKLNIWSTFMNQDELINLSKECKQDTKGDLLSWTGIADQLDSLTLPSISDQEDDKICSTFSSKIIQPFPVAIDFHSSQKACQKMGGKVFFPGWNYEAYSKLPMERLDPSICNSEIWTSLKKIDTSEYLLLSTNQTKKYSKEWPWVKEDYEPNGGLVQKCIYMTEKGLGDYGCHIERCSFCEFENNVAFSLRGLCEESEIDSQYLMNPSSELENGFVTFKGFRNTRIKRVGEKWEIIDDKSQRLLGEFQSETSDKLPIGMYNWQLFDPKCNGTRTLKLTQVIYFSIFQNSYTNTNSHHSFSV